MPQGDKKASEQEGCCCSDCHNHNKPIEYQEPVGHSGQEIQKSVIKVRGLDCADCAAGFINSIRKAPGVVEAKLNFAAGLLSVEHTIDTNALLQLIKQAGYQGQLTTAGNHEIPDTKWWSDPRIWQSMIACALFMGAQVMEWINQSVIIISLLYTVAIIVGGFTTARAALFSLRAGKVDINTLMGVSVVGAVAIGQWSEGAAVVVLFSIGNALQSFTMDKTRRSIYNLMELAPQEAMVIRDGQEFLLPAADIIPGDIVVVKPGERIAVDGVIKTGYSNVNQAAITGEAVPAEKQPGEQVFAGTLNCDGALEILVTKRSDETTLSQVVKLVADTQAQKAPLEQYVDVFAGYYTPIVLGGAILLAIVPWAFLAQPFSPWFYKALVLLVISCPCALVISTPVSIISAIGRASQLGILIKSAAALEQLRRAQVLVFDKTGTLTVGQPQVTDVIPYTGFTAKEVLAITVAIERYSEHPLAKAIVEYAKGVTEMSAVNFTALAGKGARAEIEGRSCYIGNRRLFQEMAIKIPNEEQITELENNGKTVIIVGREHQIIGIIAAADALRQSGLQVVKELLARGVSSVLMLTGDNKHAAGRIAGELGIKNYLSELLPEDKVRAVENLQRNGNFTVMVGDGINDAPALAAADIGIAMGAAGTDAALETADIALMTDDLSKIPQAFALSLETVRIIKQNVVFSVVVKVLFVILALLGSANLWMAVFADTGAAILVTLNGMRLARATGT